MKQAALRMYSTSRVIYVSCDRGERFQSRRWLREVYAEAESETGGIPAENPRGSSASDLKFHPRSKRIRARIPPISLSGDAKMRRNERRQNDR